MSELDNKKERLIKLLNEANEFIAVIAKIDDDSVSMGVGMHGGNILGFVKVFVNAYISMIENQEGSFEKEHAAGFLKLVSSQVLEKLAEKPEMKDAITQLIKSYETKEED